MSCLTGKRWGMLAGLGLVWLWLAWAPGARSQEIRTVALDSVSWSIEAGAETAKQVLDYHNSPALRSSERSLFETLRGRAFGYAYHPEFLVWNLEGGLTFKQRGITTVEDAPALRIDESIPEYRGSVQILRHHALSAAVRASRLVSFVNPDFRSDFNITNRHADISLNWRAHGISQNVVGATDSYSSESPPPVEETRRTLRYALKRRTLRERTEVRMEYQETRRPLVDQLLLLRSLRMNEAVFLDHEGQRPVTLSFDTQVQGEGGRYSTGNLSLWSTQPLGRGFRVQGSANRNSDSVDDERTTTRAYWGELEHQLFKSLVSSASVNRTRSETPTGSIQDTSRDLRINYIKRTFFGSLSMYGNWGEREFREEAAGPTVRLVREDFTASYDLPFEVLDPRSDPFSVTLLDLAHPELLLVEGVDYTVTALPTGFQVTPLPGGLIQQGDSLQVSYTLLVDESLAFSESRRGYGARLNFAGRLELSAGRNRMRRNLELGDPARVLLGDEGEQVEVRWLPDPVQVLASYSLAANSSNPYKARLVEVRSGRSLGRNFNLLGQGSFSRVDYFDGGGGSQVWSARGGLWYVPSSRLQAEGHVDHITRTGRQDDGTDLFINASFRYKVRSFFIEWRYARTLRRISIRGEDTRDVMAFTIRRHF